MPLPPPVLHVVPDFPKHVYRSKQAFADHEELKSGLRANAVETRLAAHQEELDQLCQRGWVESPGDLISEPAEDEFETAEEGTESEEGAEAPAPAPARRGRRAKSEG